MRDVKVVFGTFLELVQLLVTVPKTHAVAAELRRPVKAHGLGPSSSVFIYEIIENMNERRSV